MKALLEKYARKLDEQGLAEKENALLLALDDEIYALEGKRIQALSGPGKESARESLREVFGFMNINSLLFAFPGRPYGSILREILRYETGTRAIIPQDCETRTFFHDIPVIPSFDAPTIAQALSRRKSAIVNVDGLETPIVVSYGTVSPEQAFVSFSSTCFSTFVKYFYDYRMYLEDCGKKRTHPDRTCIARFNPVAEELNTNYASMHSGGSRLMEGPPHEENKVLSMLDEAGKRLVNERLVDSFFGNISCFYEDSIYISETASSLDELPGNIDSVPIDGSSSAGITSSSEYSTHRSIYMNRDVGFILHGHPRFSVIMSMVCLRDCELRGQCHRLCREKRDLFGVPIVPGEIGTGPTGIVHTVPKALQTNDAVIVFGHGVFTAGRNDFNGPFVRMKEIERACKEEYFRRVAEMTVR